MNVCFKRMKKIAEVSLSEQLQLSCASTLLQSTRNVSIEIFSYKFRSIHRKTPALWVSFFYKVTRLQCSGLQHRRFLVNNMKFLRTIILKNICQPLTSAFFKLILWNSWKKIHSTNKVTETHLKIWKYFYSCTRL